MDFRSLYARLSSLSDRQILFALVALTVIVHQAWFLNTSVLTGGDWFFDYTDSGRMTSLMSAWAFPAMGGPHLGTAAFPLYILTMPVEWFWGVAAGERVLFWLIALGAAVFPYLLVKHMTGSRIGAFFASIFYSYNTFFLALQTSGIDLCSVYALAPLILYLHLRALEEKRYLFVLANVLLISFTAFLDFRGTYMLILLLGFTTLSHILFTRRWTWPIVLGILSAAAIFLVNFFWMYHFFFSSGINDFVGTGLNNVLVGDAAQGMQYALNLANPFWTGAAWHLATPQPLPVWGWFIPLFLIAAFWFSWEEKDAYLRWMVPGLLIFGLGAVFLVKTTRPPFSEIYPFLFSHFPGFNAFRETGKITLLAAAALVLPLGYGAARFFSTPALSSRPLLRLFIALLMLGALLIQAAPLPTGEIGTLFVPRTPPPSYLPFKEKLDADPAFYRTLWVPEIDRYAFRSPTHPAVQFNLLNQDAYFSALAARIGSSNPAAGDLKWPVSGLRALAEPYGQYLLAYHSIRYVVIPDDYPQPELISPPVRADTDQALSRVPYLRRLFQDGGLIVYENQNYADHLHVLLRVAYAAPNTTDAELGKLNPAEDAFTAHQADATWLSERLSLSSAPVQLNWASHGAAEYEINATSNGPFLLAFSETYDSRWAAYLLADNQSFAWWALPPASSEMPHFKINGMTNAFWVEPCAGSCRVALFYKPQATLLWGAAVSIPSFLLIVALMYFSWRRGWGFISLSTPLSPLSKKRISP